MVAWLSPLLPPPVGCVEDDIQVLMVYLTNKKDTGVVFNGLKLCIIYARLLGKGFAFGLHDGADRVDFWRLPGLSLAVYDLTSIRRVVDDAVRFRPDAAFRTTTTLVS
jgi:hypothetical protein